MAKKKQQYNPKEASRANLEKYIKKLEDIALNGSGIAQMQALSLLVKLAEAEQDVVDIGPIKISLKPIGDVEKAESTDGA